MRSMITIIRGLAQALADPQLRGLLGLIAGLIGIATLFYHQVEGWRLLDALYFSVMTLATVGYGDFAPRTDMGKLFTIGLVFSGIGLFVATASALGDRIVAQRSRSGAHKE
ncbi:MAG: two pore domain potassium channel family protein [Proteobacteria bacterium]|nr:two pore domain potassium channel family protein [Pseudomonadota bacterium]